MRKKLLILISDHNLLFSYGLSLILLNHLSGLGWNVTITHQLCDGENADIEFIAGDPQDRKHLSHTKLWTDSKSKLTFSIVDSDRATPRHFCKTVDGIIYRDQSVKEITTQVASFLDDDRVMLNSFCPVRLSQRELEVIRYFSEGYHPSEVALTLGINIKTVSAHKRNAMKKMGISRNNELYHWLLNGRFQ